MKICCWYDVYYQYLSHVIVIEDHNKVDTALRSRLKMPRGPAWHLFGAYFQGWQWEFGLFTGLACSKTLEAFPCFFTIYVLSPGRGLFASLIQSQFCLFTLRRTSLGTYSITWCVSLVAGGRSFNYNSWIKTFFIQEREFGLPCETSLRNSWKSMITPPQV